MNSNPDRAQKNVREAAHKALDEVLNRMFDKQLLQKGEIFEVKATEYMRLEQAGLSADLYRSIKAELIQRNTGEYEIEELQYCVVLVKDNDRDNPDERSEVIE